MGVKTGPFAVRHVELGRGPFSPFSGPRSPVPGDPPSCAPEYTGCMLVGASPGLYVCPGADRILRLLLPPYHDRLLLRSFGSSLFPCTPHVVVLAESQEMAGVSRILPHTREGTHENSAGECAGTSCHTIQARACSKAPCSSAVRGRRVRSLLPGAGPQTVLLAFTSSRSWRERAPGASSRSPRSRAR